jgi:hypothetical protein
MGATQLVVAAVEEGLGTGLDSGGSSGCFRGLPKWSWAKFYKIEELTRETCEQKIILEKKGERFADSAKNRDGTIKVVPFKTGEEILSLRWK